MVEDGLWSLYLSPDSKGGSYEFLSDDWNVKLKMVVHAEAGTDKLHPTTVELCYSDASDFRAVAILWPSRVDSQTLNITLSPDDRPITLRVRGKTAVILWGNYVEKVAGTGKSMDLNESEAAEPRSADNAHQAPAKKKTDEPVPDGSSAAPKIRNKRLMAVSQKARTVTPDPAKKHIAPPAQNDARQASLDVPDQQAVALTDASSAKPKTKPKRKRDPSPEPSSPVAGGSKEVNPPVYKRRTHLHVSVKASETEDDVKALADWEPSFIRGPFIFSSEDEDEAPPRQKRIKQIDKGKGKEKVRAPRPSRSREDSS